MLIRIYYLLKWWSGHKSYTDVNFAKMSGRVSATNEMRSENADPERSEHLLKYSPDLKVNLDMWLILGLPLFHVSSIFFTSSPNDIFVKQWWIIRVMTQQNAGVWGRGNSHDHALLLCVSSVWSLLLFKMCETNGAYQAGFNCDYRLGGGELVALWEAWFRHAPLACTVLVMLWAASRKCVISLMCCFFQ